MTSERLTFIHEYQPSRHAGARTLLLLHGTGGNERDLLPVGQYLAPGAGLLSPRGKVLEHGMPRFFRRLAEGVFDLEDLKLRTQELLAFIREASEQYEFDAKDLIAVGYSNGANIAASLLLTEPNALGGAVLLRPMLPFMPATPPNLQGKPVLIAAGRQDQVIPAASTAQLASLLRESGAQLDERIYPAGHGLTQQDLDDAKAWLAAIA